VSYNTRSEIEAVVLGFETCILAKDEFPHARHLTVAVWYLSGGKFDQAFEKMRTGLFRFLDHHGVGREKYNETLTFFWMKLISKVIAELQPDLSLVEITNLVIERLANSRLVFEYYTPELLQSEEAKRKWVEPDLRKII